MGMSKEEGSDRQKVNPTRRIACTTDLVLRLPTRNRTTTQNMRLRCNWDKATRCATLLDQEPCTVFDPASSPALHLHSCSKRQTPALSTSSDCQIVQSPIPKTGGATSDNYSIFGGKYAAGVAGQRKGAASLSSRVIFILNEKIAPPYNDNVPSLTPHKLTLPTIPRPSPPIVIACLNCFPGLFPWTVLHSCTQIIPYNWPSFRSSDTASLSLHNYASRSWKRCASIGTCTLDLLSTPLSLQPSPTSHAKYLGRSWSTNRVFAICPKKKLARGLCLEHRSIPSTRGVLKKSSVLDLGLVEYCNARPF